MLLASSNASQLDATRPHWIVTSNTSSVPASMLNLRGPLDDDDSGAVRGWRLNGRKLPHEGEFLLFSTSSSKRRGPHEEDDDVFLVGGYYSASAGYMLYLDYDGRTAVWPYDPGRPDPEGAWKLVPYADAEGEDYASFFIVSGNRSRWPNQMLYVTNCLLGHGVSCPVWSLRFNASDAAATFAFVPAPPSPPVDFGDVQRAHQRLAFVNAIIFLAILGLCVVLCCIYCVMQLRAKQAAPRQGAVSSGLFVWPGTQYQRVP